MVSALSGPRLHSASKFWANFALAAPLHHSQIVSHNQPFYKLHPLHYWLSPFASLAAQGFSRGPSACWRRAWKIWCTLCHSTMHPGIMSISTPMAYAPKYLPLWSIPKGADILGKWFTPQTTSKLFRETHLMIMFASLRSREWGISADHQSHPELASRVNG